MRCSPPSVFEPSALLSANALAERFVGTIRRECLDQILILGRRHLKAVLGENVERYDSHRLHRTLSPASTVQRQSDPGSDRRHQQHAPATNRHLGRPHP
jgi:hypothetical protein